MSSDPVSWLMIEPGWTVVDSTGNEVGRVEEVTGDSSHDIFNGLAVASGMFGRPRYVPAEQVVEISEGRVRIAVRLDELSEYREAASEEVISPAGAGLGTRLETDLAGPPVEHEHALPLLRRVLLWLGIAGRR